MQWKIQGTFCFQGKRKLLKNPECKEYIQYSAKFRVNPVFQGKRESEQDFSVWPFRSEPFRSEPFRSEPFRSGPFQSRDISVWPFRSGDIKWL